MKKYIVFCGNHHTIGWKGYRESFDTLVRAINFISGFVDHDWAEVIETENMTVVWKCNKVTCP